MSPTHVQGHKTLGHPKLLSQAISMELGERWSSQNINHHPYGKSVHAGQVLEPLGSRAGPSSENFY